MPPLLLKALGPAEPCSLPCCGVLFHAKQGNYTVMLRWCRTSTASASLPCLLVCARENKYEGEKEEKKKVIEERRVRGSGGVKENKNEKVSEVAHILQVKIKSMAAQTVLGCTFVHFR